LDSEIVRLLQSAALFLNLIWSTAVWFESLSTKVSTSEEILFFIFLKTRGDAVGRGPAVEVEMSSV
jgi:hypothetical protein